MPSVNAPTGDRTHNLAVCPAGNRTMPGWCSNQLSHSSQTSLGFLFDFLPALLTVSPGCFPLWCSVPPSSPLSCGLPLRSPSQPERARHSLPVPFLLPPPPFPGNSLLSFPELCQPPPVWPACPLPGHTVLSAELARGPSPQHPSEKVSLAFPFSG